jgi:hypothetical protein
MTSPFEPTRHRALLAGADLPWVHISEGVVRQVGEHTFVECGTYLSPVAEWHDTEADAVRSTLPRLEQLHDRLGQLIEAVKDGRRTIASPGESGPSAAWAARPEVASNTGSP